MADTPEFTTSQRVTVAYVLTRVMDEMDDSGHLDDMYGPFQPIVTAALQLVTSLDSEDREPLTAREVIEIWSRDRNKIGETVTHS